MTSHLTSLTTLWPPFGTSGAVTPTPDPDLPTSYVITSAMWRMMRRVEPVPSGSPSRTLYARSATRRPSTAIDPTKTAVARK